MSYSFLLGVLIVNLFIILKKLPGINRVGKCALTYGASNEPLSNDGKSPEISTLGGVIMKI